MRTLTCLLLATSFACAEFPVEPAGESAIAFAKGGGKPQPAPSVRLTIQDGGVLSDGQGSYVAGECGFAGSFNIAEDLTGANMHLSGDPEGCPAARSATLRLLVRHVTDDPHVDDATDPLGEFAIAQFKLVLTNNVGVVNASEPLPGTSAPTSCFEVGNSGRKTGRGLRFDAVNFPGSNSLVVTSLGNGAWQARTAPYPNNVAYCENDDGISFWHVDMDLVVAPKS